MSDRSQVVWLRKAMAGFGLLLLAITWRLWTPQTEFPQIPFLAGWSMCLALQTGSLCWEPASA